MSGHGESGTALDALTLAERLRDLHPPDPIGPWPPAPGWWALGVAALVLGGWAIGRALLHRRAGRRDEPLRQELQACHDRWRRDGDTARYYRDVARALRRAAITRDGRAGVAGLCGERWVEWLERGASEPLSPELRAVLADALYRRHPPDHVAAVHRELSRRVAAREIGHRAARTTGAVPAGAVAVRRTLHDA